MLTPEEERRLEHLCEAIGTEQLDAGAWEVTEFRWLVAKLKELNNQMKEHQDCCLHEGECKVGEELPKNMCPHGYSKGDHHWFGCMGISPFEEESSTNAH